MPLPLVGIRVLDLTRLLPGPYCTMFLADMGAEVIKVETPRIGDYARFLPPELGLGGMFEAVNRGKKSVGLNYRNRRGRELFLALVETADVVVESFRPGAMARWRIDYPTLKELKSELVYCSLSGYGQSGPYRDRAGHDLNYLAIAGALDLNGLPGGPPIPPGVAVADLAGGMLAAISILGALVGRARHKDGQGAYLDVALIDAVVSWLAPLAGSLYFTAGQVPRRGELALSGGLPCFNVYQTADGSYLTLAALEPHFWGAFCETAGRPDLLSQQFDPAIQPEIAAIFQQRPRQEWLSLFEGVDACLEPVNSFPEVLADPQVRHRGLVLETESQDGAQPTGINSPSPYQRGSGAQPLPELGEHTRAILSAIGIDEAEIEELAEKGVLKV